MEETQKPENTWKISFDSIKEYLEHNGIILEDLSKASFLKDKFKENYSDEKRFFVFFEKEKNILESEFRDYRGFRRKGPIYRIKIIDNNLVLEEVSKEKREVQYTIDFPASNEPYDLFLMNIITYYLDRNGEKLLATETRNEESTTAEPKEEDLDILTPDEYEVYKENIKEGEQYPLIDKIEEITNLRDRVDKLVKESDKNRKMVGRLLEFAETVKRSMFGKFFFRKALYDVEKEDEEEIIK